MKPFINLASTIFFLGIFCFSLIHCGTNDDEGPALDEQPDPDGMCKILSLEYVLGDGEAFEVSYEYIGNSDRIAKITLEELSGRKSIRTFSYVDNQLTSHETQHFDQSGNLDYEEVGTITYESGNWSTMTFGDKGETPDVYEATYTNGKLTKIIGDYENIEINYSGNNVSSIGVTEGEEDEVITFTYDNNKLDFDNVLGIIYVAPEFLTETFFFPGIFPVGELNPSSISFFGESYNITYELSDGIITKINVSVEFADEDEPYEYHILADIDCN